MVVSPYFSPIRTRNRIKIEYEDNKNDLKPKVSVCSGSSVKNDKYKIKLEYIEPQTETEIKGTNSAIPKVAIKSEDKEVQNIRNSHSEPDCSPIKKLIWVPVNWEETLENIRKMRREQSAPVDTMGCHKCSDDGADEKVL